MSRFLSMSDFEWASAARYIEYVSMMAKLENVEMTAVLSFRLPATATKRQTVASIERLRRKKGGLLARVRTNQDKLKTWVDQRRSDGLIFQDEEMAVLRSFWVQLEGCVDQLQNHIARCDMLCAIYENASVLDGLNDEEEEDEIPF